MSEWFTKARSGHDERNIVIVRLAKCGVGLREIARRIDERPGVIAGVLHREGLTVKPRGRGNGSTPEFRAMVAAEAEKTSGGQAALTYGVSQTAVSYWRRGLLMPTGPKPHVV